MNKKEYKKEFVQFLKTKRVYSKYMRNLKKQMFRKNLDDAIDLAFDQECAENPVTNAFTWSHTPEGFSFWCILEDLWLTHINNIRSC